MKKLIFCFMLAVASCGLSLSAAEESKVAKGELCVIPKNLTNDGKAVLCSVIENYVDDGMWEDVGYSSSYHFCILNNGFNTVEEFYVNGSPFPLLDFNEDYGYSEDAPEYLVCKGLFSNGFNYLMENSETGGLDVFDSSNRKVETINIPSGYSISEDFVIILTWESNKYLIVPVRDYTDDNDWNYYHYSAIYKINVGSGVEFLKAIPSLGVSPRAPKKGESVAVTINPEVAKAGCNIQVVSTSGQTMLNASVPAGNSRYDIDTSRYPKGMYMVTVTGAGYKNDSVKIIIR